MDTSKMLLFPKMDMAASNKLFDQMDFLRAQTNNIFKTLDAAFVRSQITELFEANYDLGQVKEVYEIFGGYVNRSFGVVVEKDGRKTNYFVRKYKAEITEADIMYEHNLINFALEKGLNEAAGVFKAKSGDTFVKMEETLKGKTAVRYFAVYVYLEGEDRYTWIENENTPQEFYNLGALAAKLHNYSREFDPGDLAKVEPKFEIFMPTRPQAFREMAARPDVESNFHDFFNLRLESIINTINQNAIPAEAYAQMPQTPIHGDLHAGNVKWVGDNAVGIFDFDWSKIDIRFFDVCFALIYCCASWRVENDGILRLDDCRSFLKGYNDTLKRLSGLEPINETEKKYFTQMMALANVYLIDWCTSRWYYLAPEATNSYEAMYYLVHMVRLMEWMEEHRAEMNQIIADL